MIVHGTDRHQRLGQLLEGPKWIVGVRETPLKFRALGNTKE